MVSVVVITLLKLLDVDALNKLKKKVANEFLQLICKVKKGYRLDYEFILEEISLIQLIENNELNYRSNLNKIQYYLNNKWQIIQS